MALYRCAACGSPNVVMDTQQQGYDYVKGAIGTVVLGVGGAAAGINGKTKTVYKCPDCGLTLNEPMSLEIKTLIDIGVMSPSSRNNLTLGGFPIDWEVFVRKYRNIENGIAGAKTNISEKDEDSVSSSSSAFAELNKVDISADEKDRNRRVYKVARNNYIKECLEWAEKCKALEETKNALITETIKKEKARLTEELKKERDTCIAKNTEIKESSTKELVATEELLASLGFFKFSEKREAKEKIEIMKRRIENATNAIDDAKKKYASDIRNIGNKAKKAQTATLNEIEKKHPMPRKPAKPFVLIKFKKDGEVAPAMDVGKLAMQNAIFEYIEKKGGATYSQIKKGCVAISGMTDSWIQPMITALVHEDEIKKSGEKYTVIYEENPRWEVRLISEEDMRAYEAYQREEQEKEEKAKKKEKEEKARAKQAEKEQSEKILEIMKGKGPITVDDIREYSPEFDTPSTPKIMNQLAKKGVIIKTEKNRRSFFEYK